MASLFIDAGVAGMVGTIAGVLIGGAVGAVGGAILGAGVAGTVGGVVGGVIGAAIGAIIGGLILGLVGALIGWIVGLFESDEDPGGQMNLLFSVNGGRSWTDKATFGRSHQSPAVAWGASQLFVGWIGADDDCHTIAASQSGRRASPGFEKTDPCALALAADKDGTRSLVAFRGTDNKINVMWSEDGTYWKQKLTIPGSEGPPESAPAIAVLTDRLGETVAWVGSAVAWVGNDRKIRITRIDPWPPTVAHTTTYEAWTNSTGAPALSFLGRRLLLAWAGNDPQHHLNVAEINLMTSAEWIDPAPYVLSETTTSRAGVGLANNGTQVFIAWVGTDLQLNVAGSYDLEHWRPRWTGESAPDDCGPALSGHTDGTLCLAWTGRG